MYRLGLQLTLQSGREALTRLLVTAAAVALGVAVLLAVLADFDAFQATNAKPAWESTQAISAATPTSPITAPGANVELWNYSDTVFEGRTIEVLALAALGPQAPVPPGVPGLPSAGRFYASPALAALLRTTPADQLGDRFPGTQVGTIGDQALTGPTELVVYVGYQPAQLAALPQTIRVDTIASGPQTSVWTNYFRDAFGVGAVAFVFPILFLIGMATRLSATRREERYASLRLVGATPGQISVIASVDAVVSALSGTVLGIGLFELVRPLLADTALTGSQYFSSLVEPTALDFVALLVVVPLASAAASLLSLRRVRISPLGVSRKVTPPPPRARRAIPLAVGIVLFLTGLGTSNSQQLGLALYPGILITLVGLPIGGPWLTAQAARLLSRRVNGAPTLLAARRLADNPKAAYRSVGGLVLAVFLGTLLAGLMPAINASTQTPAVTVLDDVLLDTFTYGPTCGNEVNCSVGGSAAAAPNGSAQIAAQGLPPQAGATLLRELQAFHGAVVVPVYSLPQSAGTGSPPAAKGSGPPARPGPAVPGPGAGPADGPDGGPIQSRNGRQGPGDGPYESVVDCAQIAQISALGQCAAGVRAVQAETDTLSSDNPTDSTQAVVDQHSPAASADFSGLSLQAVLVQVADPSTLEVVRTFLTTHARQSESGQAPRTFGESVRVRATVGALVQRMVDIVVLLTLIVAGCSLAVALGGSLVERRRPFSLMRLSGTPVSALYQSIMLEATLPLAAATLVAAVTGYLLAAATAVQLGPPGTPIPVPGGTYFATMGAGLVVSLALIAGTLPFLGRITRPENARFE
ncbi:MAG TPA: FtsX-like permease family protein [Actinocrinis sp.]|nr:FtsX-like permease family protein [Actinocrinis sp.]